MAAILWLNSNGRCGGHRIGPSIDHRDRIGTGIGHINTGAIGRDREIQRIGSNRNRGFHGIGPCVYHGDRVRFGVGHIRACPVWGNGNINRLSSHSHGRDHRIGCGVDHRDALGPSVGYIDAGTVRSDLDLTRTSSDHNRRFDGIGAFSLCLVSMRIEFETALVVSGGVLKRQYEEVRRGHLTKGEIKYAKEAKSSRG